MEAIILHGTYGEEIQEIKDLDIAGEINCFCCKGSGEDRFVLSVFFNPKIKGPKCNACKGTGKQLVGL